MSSNTEMLRRKKQEQQPDLSSRYGGIGIKAVAAAAGQNARETDDAGTGQQSAQQQSAQYQNAKEDDDG